MPPKNYTIITTTTTTNTTTNTCLLDYTTYYFYTILYYFKKLKDLASASGSDPQPPEGFLRRDTIILPYSSPSLTGEMLGLLKGLFQSYIGRTRSSITSC